LPQDIAMPQPSRELQKSCETYARLMEEIKRRHFVISQVFNQTIPMPQMAAFEFCYLQLRKICEVFALGCLAAHGDIPGVRSKLLQKTYSADQIMKQLTQIHPQFYPVPSKQIVDQVTQKPIEVTPIATGFLTKDELVTLYGECGNYLHRGTIRQLLGKWKPTPDFEKITLWGSKLVALLSHHQIQTNQSDLQIWFLMHAEDGNVHWSIMEKLAADDPRIPH
jgi:hypothetical protein